MTKQLIVLLLAICGIQAQDSFPELFKNSWKQNSGKSFKTRDEFVKHLREDQKRSVRSWALHAAHHEEERVWNYIVDNIDMNWYSKRLLKAHFNKLSSYNPDQINNHKVTICCETACSRDLINTIKNIFDACGRSLNIHLNAQAGESGINQVDEKMVHLDVHKNASPGVIAHEAGHVAFNHSLKDKLLPDHVVKSLYRKQIEFTADIFAATMSKEYATERKNDFVSKLSYQSVVDTIYHPTYSDRLKIAKDIYKLLEAEERWFKTPKADEMYGNVAYERAWVKHCEQLEQQNQSKLKQWLGYLKKAGRF